MIHRVALCCRRPVFVILGMGALVILAAVTLPCGGSLFRLHADRTSTLFPSTSDRFGFGVNNSYGHISDFDVAQLQAGWYVDWYTHLSPSYPAGLDYMHIVRLSGDAFSPDLASLASIVTANPGATWIIGNEPDCIWQDNSTPDQYARVYHELYTFLKGRDPACQVTIGGIVQTTPLRLQWLDAVRARYQALYGTALPVDLWNIHAFVLREERGSWGCEIPPGINARSGMLWEIQDHDDINLFRQQIVRFRQWMKDRGERDKELIVSEYGILLPEGPGHGFDEVRVRTFMLNTFDYFMTATDPELGHPLDGNRLVQRWAWYSLNDNRFEGYRLRSHLFDSTSKEITSLGLAFEDYVASQDLFTPYVDLMPAKITSTPSQPLTLDGRPITLTLTAMVRNTGNTDTENVPIQFWAGDPTHPIGSIQTVVTLPARSLGVVSVEWQNVCTGAYTVGVTVDPDALITESDEENNQLSRTLLVAQHATFMPLAFR